MKKLVIHTGYPKTVCNLLKAYELVENRYIPANPETVLVIDYLDDALSQEIAFWFVLAEGCGLIDSYQLNRTNICKGDGG